MSVASWAPRQIDHVDAGIIEGENLGIAGVQGCPVASSGRDAEGVSV